jgi:CBS domain containing-hemolysin-like protein
VVVEHDEVAGLLSERDYARKVILEGKSSKETRVRDIMSRRVVCVSSQQRMDSCMALMTEKRVRHLPVLENEQLAGVISIGDVVKAIIEDRFGRGSGRGEQDRPHPLHLGTCRAPDVLRGSLLEQARSRPPSEGMTERSRGSLPRVLRSV